MEVDPQPSAADPAPVDHALIDPALVDSTLHVSTPVDSTLHDSTLHDSTLHDSTPLNSTPVNFTPVNFTPVNFTPVNPALPGDGDATTTTAANAQPPASITIGDHDKTPPKPKRRRSGSDEEEGESARPRVRQRRSKDENDLDMEEEDESDDEDSDGDDDGLDDDRFKPADGILETDFATALLGDNSVHSRINDHTMARVNALFGRMTPAEYFGPEDPVPVPGFKEKRRPKFHQVYSFFAAAILNRSHTGGEPDEAGRQTVGAIIGHEMGIGKTMYPLLAFVFNILGEVMKRHIKVNAHAHLAEDAPAGSPCPHEGWRGEMACYCQSDCILHVLQPRRGAHLHATPHTLLPQFLREWAKFVDVTALHKLAGVKPVLMVAYDSHSDVKNLAEFVAATDAAYKAFVKPDLTWDEIELIVEEEDDITVADDPHAWLKLVKDKSLLRAGPAAPERRSEFLFILTSQHCLSGRTMTAVTRTVKPDISSARVWPLRCTGDGGTCAASVGNHRAGTQHVRPKPGWRQHIATGFSLRIREITFDEFHRFATDCGTVIGSLSKMVEGVRREFGWGPTVTPMSGTPLSRSVYDILVFLLTQKTDSWKGDDVLKPFAAGGKICEVLQAQYKRLSESITSNNVSAKLWNDDLEQKGRPPPEVATAVAIWKEMKLPAAKTLLDAYLVRFDDETTMNGRTLLTLPPLTSTTLRVKPVPGTAPLVAAWRTRYAYSSTLLARQLAAKLTHDGSASGKAKRGANAEETTHALKEKVRPYMMAKDFPAIPEVVEGRAVLLTSGGLVEAQAFTHPHKHAAFDHAERLYDTSSKAQALCRILAERWGATAWKESIAPGEKPHVSKGWIDVRLDPVLVTVNETPMAPFVWAAIEHRFPGLRVEAMWPGSSTTVINDKINAFEGQELKGEMYHRPIDVLLLPARVAAHGFNLTTSDLMIHFDVIAVGYLQRQVRKRNHRSGQRRPCKTIQLSLDDQDKLDEKLMRARKQKEALTIPLLAADGVDEPMELEEGTVRQNPICLDADDGRKATG